MPYNIERLTYGVVKRFSGAVTYENLLDAERRVCSDPNYTMLQFVVADFIGADYHELTRSQLLNIHALRIGGHYSNPRIRYAYVTLNPAVRAQMDIAELVGDRTHHTQMFDTYEQAAVWVALK